MSNLKKPHGVIDFRSTLNAAKSESPDFAEVAKRAAKIESEAFKETVITPKGQVRAESTTQQERAITQSKPAAKQAATDPEHDRLRPRSLRLSEDELKFVTEAADRSNTTTSRLLRAIVREWIGKQKES